MRILVTDVTEMHHGNYCVAGWRAATGSMVRPLPDGANWTAHLLAAHGVTPGATIQFQESGTQPNGTYPHRTEDTPINASTIARITLAPRPWLGANAPPVTATLAEAFENKVQHNSIWNGCYQGAHVPEGTQCRSLWAVRIDRRHLNFVEEYGKLKGILGDGTAVYKLAISAKSIKETWRDGDARAVIRLLPNGGPLHVRVGLARAFAGQPGKCTVMINGVYW
jgi:hypothetical protein